MSEIQRAKEFDTPLSNPTQQSAIKIFTQYLFLVLLYNVFRPCKIKVIIIVIIPRIFTARNLAILATWVCNHRGNLLRFSPVPSPVMLKTRNRNIVGMPSTQQCTSVKKRCNPWEKFRIIRIFLKFCIFHYEDVVRMLQSIQKSRKTKQDKYRNEFSHFAFFSDKINQ